MNLVIVELVLWLSINFSSIILAILDIYDNVQELEYILQHNINGYRKSLIQIHFRSTNRRLIASSLLFFIGILAVLADIFSIHLSPELFNILFSAALFIMIISDFIINFLNRTSRKQMIKSFEHD